MQERKRLGSNGDKQIQFRRHLRLERFEPRQMLASDLLGYEYASIPKEPIELVQADQAHYNSPPGGNGTSGGPSELIPLPNTFQLHSRPSATKTIYLDFDGFTASGTAWNIGRSQDPIISPAWDVDGDGPGFSDNELRRVQGIWQRVAADFSAFDVNVTTEDPGEADLVRDGLGDERWGIRVVFTPDDFPGPGSGGVAYIGSFNWGYESDGATDTPCYVFNMSEVAAAGAASHEVGHALGLSHDGNASVEYYEGHGTGETSWGPIMGVGGYYRNVTTWDDGTYSGSNNGTANANYGSGPDDLQIITTDNGFGYVPDPEANSIDTATPITVANGFSGGLVAFDQFGVISETDDVDYFEIQIGTGTLNLTIDPYVSETWIRESDGSFTRSLETAYFDDQFWSENQGANLDVSATLLDADGNVVATSNPAGLRAIFTDVQLSAGVYYVSIDGVGFGTPTANPPTGYSDYASIGQYYITGTAPVALGLNLANSSFNYTEDSAPVHVADSVAVVDGIVGNYAGGSIAVSITPAPASTDRLGFAAVADLKLTGVSIAENGVTIATLSQPTAATLNFALNGNATIASIEKLVRSVTFQATGNSPSTAARSVQFQLTKSSLSTNSSAAVNVIPTNDAPSMQSASMSPILEDALTPAGQVVRDVFATAFSDPDPGDSLSGIAIVANNTPSSQGVWQFSVNATDVWRPLVSVSAGNRLVLSANARLRFIPSENFNGPVTPIMVQAIDSSFTGQFSTPTSPVYLTASIPDPLSPFAVAASALSTTVTAVNDAPRPQVNELRFIATQEQQLVGQIPSTTFFDVEGSPLSYTAMLANGLPLPNWLRLNASTASFVGTPGSLDVVRLDILLRATDPGGLFATLPVVVEVININDPPTNLRLSNSVVAENAANASVGRLNAVDPDGDAIVWTSSDPRFIVRDNEVFVVGSLDYEAIPLRQIPVTFTASDTGSPSLSNMLNVSIRVTDVNEFYPIIVSDNYVIPDGTAAGTLVGLVQASDDDIEQVVKYRLHSGDTTALTINELTGELRLANQANVKALSSYKVFVEAYDNGTPSLKTSAQIVVTVEPQNLSAPTIAAQQTLEFLENVVSGTIIGQIQASDADDTPLIYELVNLVGGSTDWLQVDPRTGVIRATAAHRFDFESGIQHAIDVIVTEDATEARATSARIPIVLLNVNDPPTAIGPLAVYSQRQGAQAKSDFVFEDQDPSSSGYTVTTTDARFEVRNGRLALRPNQFVASSLAGSVLTVAVDLVDNSDPTSTATLDVDVLIEASAPWQNPLNAVDVNRDGDVTAFDVLQIINQMNQGGSLRFLPDVRPYDQVNIGEIDTSGDNFLSPFDVLLIVNHLNSVAEGEASRPAPTPTFINADDADRWFQAFSEIDEEDVLRRRRFA